MTLGVPATNPQNPYYSNNNNHNNNDSRGFLVPADGSLSHFVQRERGKIAPRTAAAALDQTEWLRLHISDCVGIGDGGQLGGRENQDQHRQQSPPRLLPIPQPQAQAQAQQVGHIAEVFVPHIYAPRPRPPSLPLLLAAEAQRQGQGQGQGQGQVSGQVPGQYEKKQMSQAQLRFQVDPIAIIPVPQRAETQVGPTVGIEARAVTNTHPVQQWLSSSPAAPRLPPVATVGAAPAAVAAADVNDNENVFRQDKGKGAAHSIPTPTPEEKQQSMPRVTDASDQHQHQHQQDEEQKQHQHHLDQNGLLPATSPPRQQEQEAEELLLPHHRYRPTPATLQDTCDRLTMLYEQYGTAMEQFHGVEQLDGGGGGDGPGERPDDGSGSTPGQGQGKAQQQLEDNLAQLQSAIWREREHRQALLHETGDSESGWIDEYSEELFLLLAPPQGTGEGA